MKNNKIPERHKKNYQKLKDIVLNFDASDYNKCYADMKEYCSIYEKLPLYMCTTFIIEFYNHAYSFVSTINHRIEMMEVTSNRIKEWEDKKNELLKQTENGNK